jgi:hypothetical protein
LKPKSFATFRGCIFDKTNPIQIPRAKAANKALDTEPRIERLWNGYFTSRGPVNAVVGAVESLAVLIAVLLLSAFPNAPRSSFGTLEGDVYRRGE